MLTSQWLASGDWTVAPHDQNVQDGTVAVLLDSLAMTKRARMKSQGLMERDHSSMTFGVSNIFGAFLLGAVLVACSSGSNPFDVGASGSGGTGATGSGGSGAAASVPVYTRSDCGTIPVSALAPSTNQAAPTLFAIGQIVTGRIDPASLTNREHHWAIQLARGFYHLVADARTADGSSTNLGIKVTRPSANGNEDSLIWGNEIGRSYRDEAFFEVTVSSTVTMKVITGFGIEDYQMGVFANAAPVPSPLFDKCPTVRPLALGESASFTFGTTTDAAAEEQWFLIDLALGNYKFSLDAAHADGVSTNISYGVDVLDRFGQQSRATEVVSTNDIGVRSMAQGKLVVGEAGSYWVRLRNGGKDLTTTMTVNPQ